MAQPWELTWQRLPLEGLANARELGGYPRSDGGQTLWRRFIRSDALADATPADIEFLRNYGVRAVLDMRGEKEAEGRPDVSLGPDVVTANISPFKVNMASTDMQATMPATWVYDCIFENREAWRGIFAFIADAPEGCVLFHCSVGKDRTGILAALLLMLAGCDRWDAFASYVPSRVNIMRLPFFRPYWDKICSDNEREHYDSRPETLGHWFDRLDAEFGGDVRAYLAWCGVSEKTMDAVRARLVE